MIRVVYRWTVAHGDIPPFLDAWRRTTRRIHREVAGARGSVLLQEASDPGVILTIARWESAADWTAFWRDADPEEMQDMRRLGRRERVEVYDEFADYTA